MSLTLHCNHETEHGTKSYASSVATRLWRSQTHQGEGGILGAAKVNLILHSIIMYIPWPASTWKCKSLQFINWFIWYAGYNYNLYKGEISDTFSQVKSSIKQLFSFSSFIKGREQMHSSLIELKKGLRQMSYKNSMTTFKSFFALLNLKRRGQLWALEFWPSSCWAALFVIACIIIYLYIICLSNNFSVMTRWEIVFSDMGTKLVLHNVFLRGCRRSGLGKEIISGNQGEGRVVKGGHLWDIFEAKKEAYKPSE